MEYKSILETTEIQMLTYIILFISAILTLIAFKNRRFNQLAIDTIIVSIIFIATNMSILKIAILILNITLITINIKHRIKTVTINLNNIAEWLSNKQTDISKGALLGYLLYKHPDSSCFSFQIILDKNEIYEVGIKSNQTIKQFVEEFESYIDTKYILNIDEAVIHGDKTETVRVTNISNKIVKIMNEIEAYSNTDEFKTRLVLQ